MRTNRSGCHNIFSVFAVLCGITGCLYLVSILGVSLFSDFTTLVYKVWYIKDMLMVDIFNELILPLASVVGGHSALFSTVRFREQVH